MSNSRFDTSMKIAAFRGIASQLLEKGLITPDEFRKIRARLRHMEQALITQGISKPSHHFRTISDKSQAPKGVD